MQFDLITFWHSFFRLAPDSRLKIRLPNSAELAQPTRMPSHARPLVDRVPPRL